MKAERWPIHAFDSLRGIAALAVAISHFAQQEIPFCDQGVLGRWLPQLGAWGVAVFFVLSGFCIHGAYLRAVSGGGDYNWKEFLRRRFLRIYPGLFVALVLSTIVAQFWTTGLIRVPTIQGFLGHLLLFSNFDSVNRDGINSVLWSAIVECHFYLLYPFLVMGIRRFGWRKVLFAITLFGWGYFLAASLLTARGNVRLMWQMTFPALWWKWCLGVGLAEVYFDLKERPVLALLAQPYVLCFLLVASFTPCLIVDSHQSANLLRFALPVIIAAGVLGVSMGPQRLLEIPILRWFGRISYSVYLFHPLVLVGFIADILGHWWLDLFLFLGLTIMAGAVGYYLVEAPAMKLKVIGHSRRGIAGH